MTSLQSQYLLCPPLACSTARTHQQPKIATSWETEPWQQEEQHQMSQVSDEYRQTVRNRLHENCLRARRPYIATVLRHRNQLARVWWCNRVRGSDLLNWRWVWFSDETRFMLQTRDGRTGIYRRRNERFTRNSCNNVAPVTNLCLGGATKRSHLSQWSKK